MDRDSLLAGSTVAAAAHNPYSESKAEQSTSVPADDPVHLVSEDADRTALLSGQQSSRPSVREEDADDHAEVSPT